MCQIQACGAAASCGIHPVHPPYVPSFFFFLRFSYVFYFFYISIHSSIFVIMDSLPLEQYICTTRTIKFYYKEQSIFTTGTIEYSTIFILLTVRHHVRNTK
jgi:hypothetical protein